MHFNKFAAKEMFNLRLILMLHSPNSGSFKPILLLFVILQSMICIKVIKVLPIGAPKAACIFFTRVTTLLLILADSVFLH